MQQLSDIKTTHSKKRIILPKMDNIKWQGKVFVKFQTDTDKLNIVVYRFRNSFYLKDNEIDLKLTEYQSLLAKQV